MNYIWSSYTATDSSLYEWSNFTGVVGQLTLLIGAYNYWSVDYELISTL